MKKEFWLPFLVSAGITISGIAFNYGITNQKVCQNEKSIQSEISNRKEADAQILSIHEKDKTEIKETQNQYAIVIQSINNSLASINTKLDLLFSGKIKTELDK